MGADASVFSQLRQQAVQPGPMDQYLQMVSAKQMAGQNDLQDIQRQLAGDQLNKTRSIRDYFAGLQSGQSPDDNKLSAIDPEYAQKYRKSNLDLQKTQADLDHTKAQTAEISAGHIATGMAAVLKGSGSDESIAQLAQTMADAGMPADKVHAAAGRLLALPPAQRVTAALAGAVQHKNGIEALKLMFPDAKMTDAGGSVVPTNTSTLPGGPAAGSVVPGGVAIPKTQTPDSVAARADAAKSRDQAERHFRENKQIETVKADPMGILGLNKNPSGAAVAGTGLSGDEYLATLPPGVAQQVKAIADGKLQISPRTLQSPQGAALIQMAMQYEPGTDQTVYVSRAKTAADAAGGKLATSNNALNTVSGHLASLAESADALNNTSIPWANKIKNFAMRNAVPGGDAKLNAFNLNLHGVADELERAYRGAGGSEGAIQEWRRNLGEASSPESFKESMAKGAEMLQSKLEANHAQYVQGMHGKPGDFQTITPHARSALDKLRGVKPEAAAGATGAWSVVK